MPAISAHFNGSVNLADTETVMREIAARIPAGVRRFPDGETGEDRSNWIFFQLQRFTGNPDFEVVRAEADPEAYETPLVRLAAGVDPERLTWPDLGYAGVYLESYQTFVRLREQGVIAAGSRFQVQYPTPLASIGAYVVPEQQQLVLPSYERAMFADLAQLVAAIPHEDLAVQWDVAVEFGVMVGGFGPAAPELFDMIVANLVRCVDQVPADIPAGLHLCYGDYGHQHFRQPESLELQVRVLNGVAAASARPVSFVSFTVPQNQRDEPILRAAGQPGCRPGDRAEFRAGALSSGRPARWHDAGAGPADRRRPAPERRRTDLGHLHRMRHGPRRPRRCPGATRPVSGDPDRRLLGPSLRQPQPFAAAPSGRHG